MDMKWTAGIRTIAVLLASVTAGLAPGGWASAAWAQAGQGTANQGAGLDTPSAQPAGDHSALASPVAGSRKEAGQSRGGAGSGAGSQAGETPLDTPSAQPAGDQSALASPVSPQPRGAALAVGTAVSMRLAADVSSGVQINGARVQGTLLAPVRTTAGTTLPAGAAVEGTVVSSARAGLVTSEGILSLQLTRVAGIPVIGDVLEFKGRQGHKDVADSAPAKGTEAMVAGGTTLNFHVVEAGKETGLVPGVPPAAGASGQGSGGQNAGGQNSGAPGAGTGPGIPQVPVHGATQGVTPR